MKLNELQTVPCVCMECGKVSYGRADRKFCSEQCRTTWHNRQKKQNRQYRSRILTVLARNYSILEEIARMGSTCADLSLLETQGFRPSFFTGFKRVRGGRDEYRCFNIRYCMSPSRIYHLCCDPVV